MPLGGGTAVFVVPRAPGHLALPLPGLERVLDARDRVTVKHRPRPRIRHHLTLPIGLVSLVAVRVAVRAERLWVPGTVSAALLGIPDVPGALITQAGDSIPIHPKSTRVTLDRWTLPILVFRGTVDRRKTCDDPGIGLDFLVLHPLDESVGHPITPVDHLAGTGKNVPRVGR